MWSEVFSVWIHAIAEQENSRVGVYQLVEELEEALTMEIELPDGFELLRQNQTGIQSLEKMNLVSGTQLLVMILKSLTVLSLKHNLRKGII